MFPQPRSSHFPPHSYGQTPPRRCQGGGPGGSIPAPPHQPTGSSCGGVYLPPRPGGFQRLQGWGLGEAALPLARCGGRRGLAEGRDLRCRGRVMDPQRSSWRKAGACVSGARGFSMGPSPPAPRFPTAPQRDTGKQAPTPQRRLQVGGTRPPQAKDRAGLERGTRWCGMRPAQPPANQPGSAPVPGSLLPLPQPAQNERNGEQV